MRINWTLPLVPLLAFSACAPMARPEPIAARDPAMGEALKYNAAIQTINPDPVYAQGGAQPGDRGDKGASAIKRYRNDQVKELEEMGTTESSGGSSSSQR